MEVNLYNQTGEVSGTINLPDKVFNVAMNQDVVKQVLDAQTANYREVIAHTKGRGEVRGGGRKPWKQKGTGRARHASIRSPIWKGGGVAFGPTKERNFEKKINKKMKQKALFMVLSSKIKDKELVILEDLKFEAPKTKIAASVFNNFSSKIENYKLGKAKRDSILLVTPAQDKSVMQAIGNLPFLDLMTANSLNVKDILSKKYLILLKDSVSVIEKTYKL